ncbi:peptidoglycan-associated lipoprotein Pal [Thalassovita aquimarina]|uniref:Peptidoglycan-associated lipoprotein n=1 Tax=Thalassovita aquimarina TaxID=2785917 RepID=A0ABS5HUP1_9RHOB|nr:peptidoglycan-associated lipoprotein Pal [Thalassovita aquimarina]MBR9652651.1 peptidoglycan-associated lipoprotein Pal [Thalassovita aquimarina]
MKFVARAIFLTSIVALAACTDAGRFGDDVYLNGGGAGAPGSADDPASPLYFQQTVGDRVFFAIDQSTLSGEAQLTLEGQAEWLLTNADYTAVIEGHADEQGTREYNLALGARRANAVQEYLVSRGVPASRLKVVSYGKERPIEICSAEACYAKNRRAVTIISADLSS